MTAGEERTDEADEADEEAEAAEAPYGELDAETAARCGLWREDG